MSRPSSSPRSTLPVPGILALTVLLAAPPPPLHGQADADSLIIELAGGTEAEAAVAAQLRGLVDRYDIGGWIRTDRVRIEEGTNPHSHPVLTLHTRHRGDDHALLSTFLHEQFHWLEDGNPDFRAAMERFAEIWPDAPAGSPEGARDRESTYRHLVVCDLELQAMESLVGSARAREILGANRHYTWIYRTVMEDPRVREVNRAHGLTTDAVWRGVPPGDQSEGDPSRSPSNGSSRAPFSSQTANMDSLEP